MKKLLPRLLILLAAVFVVARLLPGTETTTVIQPENLERTPYRENFHALFDPLAEDPEVTPGALTILREDVFLAAPDITALLPVGRVRSLTAGTDDAKWALGFQLLSNREALLSDVTATLTGEGSHAAVLEAEEREGSWWVSVPGSEASELPLRITWQATALVNGQETPLTLQIAIPRQ